MILECDLTVYTEQCCLLIIYSWFLKRRNNWILPKQKIEKWKIMAMHGRCMEELIKGNSSPWSCASLKSLLIRFLVILSTKLLHWVWISDSEMTKTTICQKFSNAGASDKKYSILVLVVMYYISKDVTEYVLIYYIIYNRLY